MKRIRCPICGVWFKRLDEVNVNEAYTVKHTDCRKTLEKDLPLIDEGTYKVIISKYFSDKFEYID